MSTNSDAIVGEPVRILVWDTEGIRSLRLLCQSTLSDQCRTESFYGHGKEVHSLGIFARQADKGNALALVLERLGIEKEQVLVIGDDTCDLAMFPHARVCVAMANALDEVKQQADVIAPSNDKEGVAWALERFVLGQR